MAKISGVSLPYRLGHLHIADGQDPFSSGTILNRPSQLVPPLILTASDEDAFASDTPRHSPHKAQRQPDHHATTPRSDYGQRSRLLTQTLTAALSVIDICSAPLETVFSFHRLFSRCMLDTDVSQNLLCIAAYGPPLARRQAMSLLATYFAGTVGHNTIARRLPQMTYQAQRTRIETGQNQVLGEDEEECHQYLPWRYSVGEERCDVCHKHLADFAVKCSLCGKGKHWSCSTGRSDSISSLAAHVADSSTPVMIHFSLALPDPPELAQQGTMKRRDDESKCHRLIGEHDLHLVNLVQLVSCGHCDLPLWGNTLQGFACVGDCQAVYHRACLDRIGSCTAPSVKLARGELLRSRCADETDIRTNIDMHIRASCWTGADLECRFYDEIMVNYQYLWLQQSMIENGTISGTVGDLAITLIEELDIPQSLMAMELKLARMSGMSAGLADYTEITGRPISVSTSHLFDHHFLTYILALSRNGAPAAEVLDQALLSVGEPGGAHRFDDTSDSPPAMTRQTIRACLAQDFAIHNTRLADILISQLQAHGLLGDLRSSDLPLVMLPDVIDNSAEVDLLLAAIEALLTDSDLALVEYGSRMLVKRAWPSSLASPEALQRIHLSVLDGIVNEVRTPDIRKLKRCRATSSTPSHPMPRLDIQDSPVSAYSIAPLLLPETPHRCIAKADNRFMNSIYSPGCASCTRSTASDTLGQSTSRALVLSHIRLLQRQLTRSRKAYPH